MAKYHYHIRSTSLPSTFHHPLTARVEEQLHKIRVELNENKSLDHYSTEMLRDGLFGLKDLYESVEDLLKLPHTQQILVKQCHDKLVDEVLDDSLRLLDVSCTTKDVLSRIKEAAQETRSALRRRRSSPEGEIDLTGKKLVEYYMSSRKKANKEVRKCLGELKRTAGKKHGFSSSSSSSLLLEKQQQDYVAVVNVLKQVGDVTVTLYESLLSRYKCAVPKTSCSGWSLVSKLMIKQNSRLTTAKDQDVQQIIKGGDGVAQKPLETLETSIQSLEEGLELVFRQLIKTRVSLLNILSTTTN
ncbi:hypothetical protein C5167_038642 [Papaver somniferum]|uniref:DUF241 domain-containing protein n=1 Tax=Papaver somniferum TaxID=3469 RepID=A0A4Y7ICE6_PAPSO|nr:uncharacterized protein LOC113349794 [Papaver somniferum]RZC45696.1 hypothetical protein C5167_038642 [Papaver somniferum]